MKALLIAGALLLPVAVMAQPAPSGGCSLSATCAARKLAVRAGNQLCLNSPTCSTNIKADSSTLGIVETSAAANSGTNVAFIFDTTNALSGSTKLLSVRKAGVEQVFIDAAAGSLSAPGGYGNTGTGSAQGLSFSGTASVLRGSTVYLQTTAPATMLEINSTAATFAGNVQTGTTANPNPVPVVHNAQTAAAQAMEYGKTAATAGALAVTFATAFASAPTCTCTGTNATPDACSITTAANTTSVTFTFGAGTDVINWICIGAK